MSSLLALVIFAALAGTCLSCHTNRGRPDWGYSGETGPSHWGDLSPDFVAAKLGKRQSPIDIPVRAASREAAPELRIDYRPCPLQIEHTGHSVQVNCAPGSRCTVGDRDFSLEQFHFHTPSEHTLDGDHAAMELHLVHSAEAGELVVIGVLIEPGEESPALARFWDRIPGAEGPSRTYPEILVDAAGLLPDETASFHYSGSLTTPPCTEGVQWFLMRNPITASRAQIDALRAVIDGNNRPVQPLNGRRILSTR